MYDGKLLYFIEWCLLYFLLYYLLRYNSIPGQSTFESNTTDTNRSSNFEVNKLDISDRNYGLFWEHIDKSLFSFFSMF